MTRGRPTALLLAGAVPLAGLAAACGGSSSSSSVSSATSAASSEASSVAAGASSGATSASSEVSSAASSAASGASGKKVVYIPGLTGNPFYSTVACGAAAEAKKQDITFSTQGAPEFDATKQTAVVNAVVASKPDAIMISIDDPKAMAAPLKQATAAGIKVLTIDGDLADTSIGFTNIQSDNLLGGKLAADRMAEVNGGKGSVAIIDNSPGFPVSEQRVKGFKDQMTAKYPDIKVLDVQYSTNETAKAASIVTSSITAHSDLSGVYTVETNNTAGALTGVREAGKQGKVHIVGYDTSDPVVQALHDKQIDGVVVQYPYGEGVLGIQSIVAQLTGKSVPRNQGAPFVIATPDNVDTPKVQQYIYKTTCS